jgi:pimeloyl-ACP methyl ester carboxylesterase
MSAITIENDLIHYEVLGRGRPVILVHGWLGSWRYWVRAMEHLSMKYRVYAIDLWGFGDSGHNPARYSFAMQVQLLEEFMARLGIARAALVGHDLGAAVIARFAATHPDRVPRLLVVSPPLFALPEENTPAASASAGAATASEKAGAEGQVGAAETNPASAAQSAGEKSAPVAQAAAAPERPSTPAQPADPPAAASSASGTATPQETLEQKARAIGEARLAAATGKPVLNTPAAETGASKPEGTVANPARPNPLKLHLSSLDRLELLRQHVEAGPDQDKLLIEVEKADPAAFAASLDAFAEVDTLRDLRALSMPAVLVYGEKDTFAPAPAADMLRSLTDGRVTFGVISLSDTRHFPMLEDSAAFSRLMMAFLEAPDVTKIELKDQWVRRVR